MRGNGSGKTAWWRQRQRPSQKTRQGYGGKLQQGEEEDGDDCGRRRSWRGMNNTSCLQQGKLLLLLPPWLQLVQVQVQVRVVAAADVAAAAQTPGLQ